MKKFAKIMNYLIIPLTLIAIVFVVTHRSILIESEYTGKQYAQKLGYHHINIEEISKFIIFANGCSITDSVKFRVRALDRDGNKFHFILCSGWPFSDPTITILEQENTK